MTGRDTIKSVVWMGSSRRDLQNFPKEVRTEMGHALYAAQRGETDPAAKPLKGFGGTRVMEITDRHDTNAYPDRVHRAARLGHVRAARLPEEVHTGDGHAATGARSDPTTLGGS